MKYKNKNNYVENSPVPFIWCLIFGSLYFIYKGIWVHAIISLILAVVTMGLSWLIYPFFASTILENNYLKNGWKEVKA